jgi:hypothetical protein
MRQGAAERARQLARHQGEAMAAVMIEDANLTLHVEGLDQLWALRSKLTIPLAHVSGTHADSSAA